MSPPNPRREAFAILRRVEEGGAYASVLLESRAASFEDPRDAALLTEIVLGVLRRRAVLDHAIAGASSRPIDAIDRRVLAALRIGAYSMMVLDRIPDFAAVDTAVALVRESGAERAAGFANGVLRRIAREPAALRPPDPEPGDVPALALAYSHPAWWTRRVVDRIGWDAATRLLSANNEPAPLTLAPWPDAAASEGLASRLAGEGVATVPCHRAPGALRVVSGVPQKTAAFRDGAFWIQDEAAQLVTALFGPRVGPRVADVCAAPGGKTLALAARLAPGGLVVACDRHPRRLARLAQNVSRLRAQGVVAIAADMSRAAPLAACFDEVLVDAPCSGTGTFRRHPEIRWRLGPDDLRDLAARQARILREAAAILRTGGRVVYAVCALEPEEGESVVSAFLEDHPGFERSGPDLRTSPADDGMDGFFAAVLARRM